MMMMMMMNTNDDDDSDDDINYGPQIKKIIQYRHSIYIRY